MAVPGTRLTIDAEDIDEMTRRIRAVLASGRLILGSETEEFEERLRRIANVRHAVAVSSGTSALEIIFRALDVRGRSVVVPSNTFYATAVAVERAGGRPRFADVGDDLMLNAESLAAAWSDDTAGAVLVHIGGMISAELDAIARHCGERNGFLVEDAAHALGSALDGRPAGCLGTAAAVSFYPTKIVTAGEGGAVLTNDDEIARAARCLRDQGKVRFDQNLHVMSGYSWRLSELHAAVGIVHLDRLASTIDRKRAVAAVYDMGLDAAGLSIIAEPSGHRWNRHKYPVVLPPALDVSSVTDALASAGVGLSGRVFDLPLHRQPVLERFADGELPVADRLCAGHICLPIHGDMTEPEVHAVIDAVRNVFG